MSYLLGVILAILAGVFNNLGTVLQKKVINELPSEKKEKGFFRTLAREPLWIGGLLLQYTLGAGSIMVAQLFIGPALLPGLIASGLIVLAIGSIKIVGETLERNDFLGIVLLLGAVILFCASGLQISITSFNFLEQAFLLRLGTFTAILIVLVGIFVIIRKTWPKIHAIAGALSSGILLAIASYWISPLVASIVSVINGAAVSGEFALLIVSIVILIPANVLAVGFIQDSFKTGQASLLIPIQQLPMQIVPGLLFLIVFFLAPPTAFSLVWFMVGVALTLVSSFLLGRRQLMLHDIG